MIDYIICNNWYENRESDTCKEATRVVSTAAKLVREEIGEIELNTDTYPTKESFLESVREPEVA